MNRLVTANFIKLTLLLVICTVTAFGQSLPGDVNGDGFVDRNDITLILDGLHTRAIGSSDPRDLNNDGKIDIADVLFAWLNCSLPNCAVQASVKIEQSVKQLTIVQNQPAFLTTYLNYSSGDDTGRTINVQQTVTPGGASPSAVAISPAIPASYSVSASGVTGLEQQLTALTPGTYTLTTTAQLGSTGPIQQSAVSITIVPIPTTPALISLGYSPGAVPIHTNTAVTFTTTAVNYDPTKPPVITLEGVDFNLSVPMTDDGQGADLVAGDGIYSAAATITGAPGTCVTLRATTGTETSPTQTLCATNLPCFPVSSDSSNAFTDSTGGSVIKDEVVIAFTLGTTEEQIEALAANMGATIVGGLPELHAYQFKLASVPGSLAALQSMIAAVKAQPIVLSANPNGVAAVQGFQVNDPLQGHWSTDIHADSAWWWGQGGCGSTDLSDITANSGSCPNIVIAILDTGVSPHPDLGSLLTGFNANDNSSNVAPSPGDGHGEQMAGLAAALQDNKIGISGIAPNSKILPVKVMDTVAGWGQEAQVASGINWAAAHGAKVINLSLEVPNIKATPTDVVCMAITSAINKGVNVIAAAGNGVPGVGGENVNLYLRNPAMCPGVVAVGGTTTTSVDQSGQPIYYPIYGFNYGPGVAIAAPGDNVLSLEPGGYYDLFTFRGTSTATALVSGAVAMMLGRPTKGSPVSFTPAQVKARLTATSNPLALNPIDSTVYFGGGMVDVAEAMLNGSFEAPDLSPWTSTGTASIVSNLQSTCPGGLLCPQDRTHMAYLSIGATGDGSSASISQDLWPFGGPNTAITFKYAFITARPPTALPSPVNESVKISIKRISGTTTFATEAVNSSTLSPLAGITLQGGNGTAYWTGWKTVLSSPFDTFGGNGEFDTLLFSLSASGATGGYQTVLLIDQVKFQ